MPVIQQQRFQFCVLMMADSLRLADVGRRVQQLHQLVQWDRSCGAFRPHGPPKHKAAHNKN